MITVMLQFVNNPMCTWKGPLLWKAVKPNRITFLLKVAKLANKKKPLLFLSLATSPRLNYKGLIYIR